LIRRGERMGEEAQPLAQQAVDLVGRQAVADLLKPLRVGAAEHAIVERLIGDALSLQLTLGVFMAVETQLCIIGKVAAKLEKERPKIIIDGIDVVVIDHRRRLDDPRIRPAAMWATPFLGAEDRGLLLGLTDKNDAFFEREVA